MSSRISEENCVIDKFTNLLAEVVGITVKDRVMIIRSSIEGEPCTITMIITNVSTQSDNEKSVRRDSRWQQFAQKHPGVLAELYYAEHGQWPK